jgi:ribA/ribD-fused uncharacterized protein
MKITDTHIYFWDGIFSNFYPITFMYKDKMFLTSEQAFMWEKSRTFKDSAIELLILNANTPQEAKKLGRKVGNFAVDTWDRIKEQIMYDVVYTKFSSSPTLSAQLISTGNKTLVEASPFDKIWGVGLGENDIKILNEKNWQGQNLLGKVLMNVRKNLK